MNAAGIYPWLTIRFPYAAPFDCWISLFHRASEPPGLRASRVFPLSTCQLASMPPSRKRVSPCPLVPVSPCPLATFGRVQVQRSNGTA
jgi:hypothetical protein